MTESPSRPLSPRQDARSDDQPQRPLPTEDDLENLAPVPVLRGNRMRTASQDSDVSLNSHHSLSHLPPLPPTIHTSGNTYLGKTSQPTPLQSSIGFSLSKLLSFETFTQFLATGSGYQDFSEYLLAFSSPHLHTLELQRDLEQLIRLTNRSSAAARGMREAYCVPSGEKKVILRADLVRHAKDHAREERRRRGETSHGSDEEEEEDEEEDDDDDDEADFMSDMGHALLEISEPPTGLERASRHLLQDLYATEFEAFVKHRLLAHTKLQLEKRDLNKNDVAGLGEAFVLSNPKLHDCPIVLASPAFSALTGYAQEDIIGRNCRFLQGEATSKESVHEIREAIKEKRGVTQLLLNYDKSGAPFFNLLCIVPLFSPSGELIYFIGGQTDVTGALGTGTRLSLPGRNAPILDKPQSTSIDLSAFSPVVQTNATYGNVSDEVNSVSGSGESRKSRRSSDSGRSTPAGGRGGGDTKSSNSEGGVGRGTPSIEEPSPVSSKGFQTNEGSETGSTTSSSNHSKPGLKPFSRGSNNGGRTLSHRSSFLGSTAKAITTRTSGKTNEPSKGKREGERPLELKQGTVERRVNEFQTTYEKLILVARNGRKILFNTGAFLRYCGLPAATAHQIDNSALIQTDLLEVIKGPNDGSESSSEVRNKVSQAIEEGKSCSVRCGIKVEEKKILFKSRSAVGSPTAYGVLHLTPLKELNQKTTAYVAIFA